MSKLYQVGRAESQQVVLASSSAAKSCPSTWLTGLHLQLEAGSLSLQPQAHCAEETFHSAMAQEEARSTSPTAPRRCASSLPVLSWGTAEVHIVPSHDVMEHRGGAYHPFPCYHRGLDTQTWLDKEELGVGACELDMLTSVIPGGASPVQWPVTSKMTPLYRAVCRCASRSLPDQECTEIFEDDQVESASVPEPEFIDRDSANTVLDLDKKLACLIRS